MTLKFIGLGLFAFGIAFSAQQASACSCAQSSYQDLYPTTDVVFVGKVLQKTPVLSEHPGVNVYDYVFDVTKNYKGDIGSYVRLRQEIAGGLCGYDFQLGETYVVWANADATRPWEFLTSLCTHNSPVSAAGDQLRWLDGQWHPGITGG